MAVWGVVTTIFAPTPSVTAFAQHVPGSSLVVVGDKKTAPSPWRLFVQEHRRAAYLSPEDQRQMQQQFRVISLLPWNHFGRKNIGFLYALSNGAQWVFDFDDDNLLHLPIERGLLPDLLAGRSPATRLVRASSHLYNPYPDFSPVQDGNPVFMWPRGFPLEFVTANETFFQSAIEAVDPARVGVFQSLADHNPDVDAIFRLTRTLPVDFARAGAIVALPPGVYSPWNAQATLWRGSALWGSLLPITVPGRVSDIWRSYVVERLLWEVDRTVAFMSPFVTQYRNAHSYMKDFAEESDLYVKTTPLLAVLSGWTSPARSASLADAFIDIYHHLHRADIVGRLDVQVARAWVADLNASGYRWPTIDTAQPAKVLPTAPVVDERRNDLKLMHEPSGRSSHRKSPARLVGSLRGQVWHG